MCRNCTCRVKSARVVQFPVGGTRHKASSPLSPARAEACTRTLSDSILVVPSEPSRSDSTCYVPKDGERAGKKVRRHVGRGRHLVTLFRGKCAAL